MHLFKIEKLVVVAGSDEDSRESRRFRRDVIERLEAIDGRLARMETSLANEFENLQNADEEVKTELANLAGAVEALVTRMGDNPTPAQLDAITGDLRGIAGGLRTVTGTLSTLDPPAATGGDTPPEPADPGA